MMIFVLDEQVDKICKKKKTQTCKKNDKENDYKYMNRNDRGMQNLHVAHLHTYRMNKPSKFINDDKNKIL